jgi:hypothetical protein
VQRYCPPLADLLDKEFDTIKNLTYGSLGDLQGVDTFKVGAGGVFLDFSNLVSPQIRWAIWNYVLRIKGIVNDDYLYMEINKLLDKETKVWGMGRGVVHFPPFLLFHTRRRTARWCRAART